MSITNDRELQQILSGLPLEQKRIVSAHFAARVLPLTDNSRLKAALSVALEGDSSDQALGDAYRTAKSIAVQTYTACGRDADWAMQAEHFVAEACAAALTPNGISPAGTDLAWKTAMQARMARNCAMIDGQPAPTESEAERQYEIADSLLA